MSELPESWLETRLGDVIDYGKTEKAEPSEIADDAWILELEDIEKDTSKIVSRFDFSERKSKSTKNKFNAGDVLYGKLRPYLNKVVIADKAGYCTTEIIPLKPNNAVDGHYLFHWLKHPEFLEYVTAVSHGLSMPRLGTESGKDAPFVLAPFPEQKRIADKLDTLLARLDATRERLDRIPQILKQFRQAVLAAATSGRLTECWRDKNKSQFKWNEGHLSDFCDLITKGASPNWQGVSYVDDPKQTLFVTSENVGNGNLLLDMKKYVEDSFNMKQKRSVLKKGDVLTNIVGASIGRTAIFDLDVRANINQAVCIIRVNEGFLERKYLMYFLNSQNGLDQIASGAVDVARANVSLNTISNIRINIPTLAEQNEIIRRVEALFELADKLEARYQQARAQVEKLTPALLAKAFRGELVEQDPNDEPAEKLLERVRAAAVVVAPSVKKRKK